MVLKREIVASWGDGDVKELLVRAEDEDTWCFFRTENGGEKADMTQMLTLSSSRV